MNDSSCCSKFIFAFDAVNILDFLHPNQGVVVSHCFILQFPNNIWLETFFSPYAYLPSIFFLQSDICSGFLPIFKLGCSFSYFWVFLCILCIFEFFWVFLCILDKSLLSDMYFANIFSQFLTCLLILLTAFCTTEISMLMKFSLSILYFMDWFETHQNLMMQTL